MSIDHERAVTEARLRGDQNELKQIEVRADALISDIRAKVDPYADSVDELDMEAVLLLVEALAKLKERAIFIKRKIKEFEAALYGQRRSPY